MSVNMKIANSMKFNLPSGEEVELSMSQEFLEQVKNAFSLSSSGEITESHIKKFLVGSMKNALEQEDGRHKSN